MTAHYRRKFANDFRQGFTLVELMIVIAVIAVLLGLLVVGLQGVRSQASAADCANNLRQIGLALQQYRTAGDLPPKAIELKEKLAPFLKDQISRVYQCSATNNDVVYGANFCLERFQPSDNKIVAMDATQFDVPFMGGTDAEFRSIVDARHKGTANILYYDGSVTRLAIAPINPYDPVSGSANVVNYWEPEMRGCENCFSGGGLTGTYFSGQDYTGVSAARQEASLDYPFGAWEGYSVKYTLPLPGATETSVPAFSAKFTGKVRPPTTETYTFHVSVDNQASLWVNGVQILQRTAGGWDGAGGVRYVQASEPITLIGGQWVPIELRVINQGGPAHVSVRWSNATNPAIVAIPPTNLSFK